MMGLNYICYWEGIQYHKTDNNVQLRHMRGSTSKSDIVAFCKLSQIRFCLFVCLISGSGANLTFF